MAESTRWRGQRDTSRWRFGLLVVASALLHLPLTPLMALVGLLVLAGPKAPDTPVPDLGRIRAIPLDLIEVGVQDRSPRPEPEPAVAPMPAAVPEVTPPDEPGRGPEQDAGPPDAGRVADGSPPDAAGADAVGADGGELPDGSADASSADPVALSGEAGQVADANANVRLVVYTEAVRKHPLGGRVGKLLGSVAQWRDFFRPSALDPIRDFDRILIAGPQLRNSSEVVAVLRYNVASERVRAAVEAVIRQDPTGQWLDAGVPAATARADRARRVFVILPEASLVIVTPPSAAAHALSLGGTPVNFPAAPGLEALKAYVATPWRIFIGLPFSIPKSIESAEFSVTPTSSGGAKLELVLEDATPKQAKEDRDLLWSVFRSNEFVPLLELAAGTLRLTLSAQGSRIRGTLDLTPRQVLFALNLVEGWILERARARAPRVRPTPDAAAPAPPQRASEAGAPAHPGD